MAVTEKELFEALEKRDPNAVVRASLAEFDPEKQLYSFSMLNFCTTVDLIEERVSSTMPGELLKNGFVVKYWASWCLQYLLNAKDQPRVGEWVAPEALKEGRFFFDGSHAFPLLKISEKFDSDPKSFKSKLLELGLIDEGVAGDMCAELRPFPRIPMLLVCWLGDEDFGPNTSLLFDASANDQLPIDVLWGVGHFMIEVLSNY